MGDVHRRHLAAAVLLQIIGDAVLFAQRGEAGALNGADVNERVRAAVIGGDEAIALVGVEEFDGSDDAHVIFLLVCDAPRVGGQGPERQGKKEVGAAKRRRPSICDCSRADIGEGGRNCKFGRRRASGILLAGVFDGEDFDGVERDAVDDEAIGRHQRLARAGKAAGPVHMGMVDQPLGGLLEQIGEAFVPP